MDRRLTGIACVAGAVSFFALQDAIIKWMSGDYPLHEIVLVRASLAIVVTLFVMRLEGGLHLLFSARPLMHLARGLLLLVANSSFFLALAVMPLADATAIFFIAPLLITGLSAAFLGERVGPRRWAAVGVGLVGVLAIVRPGGDAVRLAALLPLVAAAAYAVLQIVTRRLGATDRASTMAFYVQATFILASAGVYLVAGDGRFAAGDDASLDFLLRAWVIPERDDLLLMLGIGVVNGFAGYLMAQGYRIAAPALVAPFEYTAMPVSVGLGMALFGDWPDPVTWVGIVLIVASGLYVLHREIIVGRGRAAGN